MRWLFLFVLALNLAYIGWQLNIEPERPAPARQPLQAVPPLLLLGEAGGGKPDAAVTAGDSAGRADDAPESVATAAVNEAPGAPLPEEAADAASEETAAGDDVAAKEEVEPEPEPAAARCYTLGPFRDLEKLRALIRDIKSYVEAADFRGKEQTEQSLYWVYIKPLKNRKQALATGKRLRAKKIKDFYIIREGDNRNGISLGYFRNKKGAQGLVKKVRKQGFDATLEPVYKTYTVYWLDYRLAAEKSVPEEVIRRHVDANKNNEIKRMSRDCAP